MLILGIETSCDETSAAVIKKEGDRVTLLSNIVSSSATLQEKYGGVLPEQAAREQIKFIIPTIEEALHEASCKPEDLDAIAVTQGPGLIGSLLVGVETAKTLALVWGKPLIPVNHLVGHFYANWIRKSTAVDAPSFPAIGLLVSGGHTDLVLMKSHGEFEYLGGTRDDAAGECFDKCARLLGLPYPGGPNLAKLAEKGDTKAYSLPRPMIGSGDLDFSFSGLKTAVANLVNAGGAKESSQESTAANETSEDAPEKPKRQDPDQQANLAASIQEAIVDVLVKKTVTALQTHGVENLIVAGGVAANSRLTEKLKEALERESGKVSLFIPSPNLCTDNAAYIATAAAFLNNSIDPLKLQANPNLSLR